MTAYRFTVPGRPVPKARPRVMGTVTFTPHRTRDHERLIWAHAVKAHVKPMPGPVELHCVFHVADMRADVDNLAKTVLDALNGTAYADDRQVVDLRASKVKDGTECTEVFISSLEGE